MSDTATIYALRDPRTNELRYIGKTVKPPAARLNAHLADKQDNYRTRWIKSLDGKPLIEPLIVVGKAMGPYAERYAIALYRSLGFRLTNLTNGGDGCEGRLVSAETRAKLSVANKGQRPLQTPEIIARRAAALRGGKHTAKARASYRLAASLRSPEHLERLHQAWRDRHSHYCAAGHEYTAESTKLYGPYNYKRCRICARAYGRAYYWRQKGG